MEASSVCASEGERQRLADRCGVVDLVSSTRAWAVWIRDRCGRNAVGKRRQGIKRGRLGEYSFDAHRTWSGNEGPTTASRAHRKYEEAAAHCRADHERDADQQQFC